MYGVLRMDKLGDMLGDLYSPELYVLLAVGYSVLQVVAVVHHHTARVAQAPDRRVCSPVQAPQYCTVLEVEVSWKIINKSRTIGPSNWA